VLYSRRAWGMIADGRGSVQFGSREHGAHSSICAINRKSPERKHHSDPMNSRADLQELVAVLQDRVDQHNVRIDQINGLLEKAELRRRKEPDNRRKWNNVLDNLEASLKEERAKRESSQVALKDARQQLERLGNAVAANVDDEPADIVLDAAPRTPEHGGEGGAAARRIRELADTALERLTLQEVALLKEALDGLCGALGPARGGESGACR